MQNLTQDVGNFANYFAGGLLLVSLVCLFAAVFRLITKKRNSGKMLILALIMIVAALLLKGIFSLSCCITYVPSGTGECLDQCKQMGYGSGKCDLSGQMPEGFEKQLESNVCSDGQYRQEKLKNSCYCKKANTCRDVCGNIGYPYSYCREAKIVDGELALYNCDKNLGDIMEEKEFTSDCYAINPENNRRSSTCCCSETEKLNIQINN